MVNNFFFISWKQATYDEARGLFAGLVTFTIILFFYTFGGNLNNVSILFPYLAFAGMGLGCSNNSVKSINFPWVRSNKRFLLYLSSFYFLLFPGTLAVYWINPPINECIQGNCIIAYGVYKYNSGAIYKGKWRNGQRHGHGIWIIADDSEYVGEWKDNRINGHGTMAYPDGSKYVGEWKNGNKHGQGTLTYPDGRKHVGKWENGKFIGK